MKEAKMNRVISLILTIVLTVSVLSSCGTPQSEDMMKDIMPKDKSSDDVVLTDVSDAAVTDFAVRLFKASLEDEKNTYADRPAQFVDQQLHGESS